MGRFEKRNVKINRALGMIEFGFHIKKCSKSILKQRPKQTKTKHPNGHVVFYSKKAGNVDHRGGRYHIYILDARRGALKRPPSRASFRRTVVPSYRRSDVQKCRCAAIPMLRPKRRSTSEMKPTTPEELKPKTSELQSSS